MRDKIRFLSAALAAMLAVSLAAAGLGGCGKAEEIKQNKKQQIELWYYWDMAYQQKVLGDLIYEFNHSQDEIEVTTRYIPVSYTHLDVYKRQVRLPGFFQIYRKRICA